MGNDVHNFAAAPKDERRAGAAVTISSLNGLTLDAKYRRDANIASVAAETDFAQHYDFRTLFYDAFHVSHKRAVCLICPPLLNFKPSVQRARFRDAGGALRGPAIHSHKRFSEVWLSHASGSGRLNLGFDGEPLSAQISPDENQSFANLNCAVIKSKNNDLQWIYDWADYYVKVHNLQGLVFFDNCSDKYDLPDIAATLAKVAGLRRAVVVSAPYTFGVYAFNDTLFLQVALLNIARLRFLARARAVLCVDLDELVAPMSEGSVFDATVATLLGYLLFEGRWREAARTRQARRAIAIIFSKPTLPTSATPNIAFVRENLLGPVIGTSTALYAERSRNCLSIRERTIGIAARSPPHGVPIARI